MSKLMNGIQWVNVLTLIAQTANNASGLFPGLVTNPYFILAQGILAAILPSLNGIGHKVAFGETQDPSKR